jgi:hypothetical protein
MDCGPAPAGEPPASDVMTAAAYLGTGFEDPGISAAYLPHLDPANAAMRGWTYLLCLRPPYKQAEHYLGSAAGLAARLRQHGTSEGARLMQVQRQAGGSFVLTRTWPGGRAVEYRLKARKNAPVLCPRCTPGTQRGLLPAPVLAPVALFPPPQPSGGLLAPRARPVLASQAAKGRRWARSWLAECQGWSADEVEQAAAAFQAPYYEGRRTPEGDALNAAFARVIEAALAALRAPEVIAS